MSIPRLLTGSILLVHFAVLTAPAGAQVISRAFLEQHTFDGNIQENLGGSVAGAGDVNQDGFADVIVGAAKASSQVALSVGKAYVYSGKDGSVIWVFEGEATSDQLGYSVAGAGDVNNDGFPDVIVGARWTDPDAKGDAGSAFVYSGKDGTEIWRFDGEAAGDNMGISVGGAGDVNQDGFPDLIVGAYWADPGGMMEAGSAYVYSGKDGTELWQFDGVAAVDYVGCSVAGAGDVNQDGFDDVIVGALINSNSNAGSAFVYSGKDGTEIWKFDGGIGDQLGNAVSGAGDVNQDGFADVIIGAHSAAPGLMFNAGSAYVYSGKDKTLIWQFDGPAMQYSLGWSVAGAGDVNGDGFPDAVVGARLADPGGMENAGSVYIYSGKDGTELSRFDGTDTDDEFGRSVGAAGDVNQDGLTDVIVGAIFAEPNDFDRAGRAFVYSYAPVVTAYGSGLAGSGDITPEIGAGGEDPQIGSPSFKIEVTDALGGAPCFIAGSLSRADISLLGGTLHGDFLTPGAFVIYALMTSGPGGSPGVGKAELPIPIPGDPTLLGLGTYWQGFVSDASSPSPVGFSHTRGLEVILFR